MPGTGKYLDPAGDTAGAGDPRGDILAISAGYYRNGNIGLSAGTNNNESPDSANWRNGETFILWDHNVKRASVRSRL
jgi:hypothetical protein